MAARRRDPAHARNPARGRDEGLRRLSRVTAWVAAASVAAAAALSVAFGSRSSAGAAPQEVSPSTSSGSGDAAEPADPFGGDFGQSLSGSGGFQPPAVPPGSSSARSAPVRSGGS